MATTPTAPPRAPSAARKKRISSTGLLALAFQRRALDRLGEQHLLGEDQVLAVVVGHLVVVPHRDRVEGAGDLAVAAEDAAREVDLVDGGVALAGGDPLAGDILGGDDADAVGGTGGGAERAADAFLEPGVLEAVQLVTAAEARVDRRLLLGVLDRQRPLDQARHRRLQAAQRLAEGTVGAADPARLRTALDLDHVLVLEVGELGHQVTTTRIAVTSTLSVASGSRTFQPKLISW